MQNTQRSDISLTFATEARLSSVAKPLTRQNRKSCTLEQWLVSCQQHFKLKKVFWIFFFTVQKNPFVTFAALVVLTVNKDIINILCIRSKISVATFFTQSGLKEMYEKKILSCHVKVAQGRQ